MSEERDWATFYQQHKDDPEMWGDPEEGAPAVRRGGLSATITVRFSPEEASEIRELARKLDVTYSDVVRRAVGAFVRPAPDYNTRQFLGSRRATQPENEDDTDFELSNAGTSTGSLAFAGAQSILL